jgi:hypothetical protein
VVAISLALGRAVVKADRGISIDQLGLDASDRLRVICQFAPAPFLRVDQA